MINGVREHGRFYDLYDLTCSVCTGDVRSLHVVQSFVRLFYYVSIMHSLIPFMTLSSSNVISYTCPPKLTLLD